MDHHIPIIFPGLGSMPSDLQNAFRLFARPSIMSDGEEILPEHLPRTLRRKQTAHSRKKAAGQTLHQMREQWLAPQEHLYLTQLLAQYDGDVREVARMAGVNPVTIYRLLKRRGISLKRSFS